MVGDIECVNTFWFIVSSLSVMLAYRIVSGYRFAKQFSKCLGFLQFLDIMLFFEIYASVNSEKGKSTLQLRWIRKMESVLESWPQALIQLIYVLRLGQVLYKLFYPRTFFTYLL